MIRSANVVGLDDQNVGSIAIGQFLENDGRGVEDEVNLLPTTATERFADLDQCRPERGVGENLKPSLRVHRRRHGHNCRESDTRESEDRFLHVACPAAKDAAERSASAAATHDSTSRRLLQAGGWGIAGKREKRAGKREKRVFCRFNPKPSRRRR